MEIDEIQEIFSQFGQIFSLKTGGDKTGYHFIRYKFLNEAITAVEELKNHPVIKLAFHSPKNRNNENGTIAKEKKNYKGKFTYNNKSKNKEDNQTHNKSADSFSIWDSVREGQEINSNQSLDCDQLSLHSEVSSRSKQTHSGRQNSRAESINSDYKNFYTRPNHGNYKSKQTKKVTHRSQDYDIPGLIKSNTQVMPDNRIKRTVIPAEEVIIANLHSDISAAYVLHLFDKYEPIGVTKIKTVEDSNIRFCRVYFKTREIAMEVENEYDETAVFGQKLVVLRPCRLVDEGSY